MTGAGMKADIAEQPEVFARLLDERAAQIAEVAARIVEWKPRSVVFTARGTSDHAALYAAYLTEIRLGLPVGLASPSAVTVYGARPDLRDTLVVGVSQSGGSPDLHEVLRVAREQGAHTLAVTNNAESPLARAAELHIDVAAGHEVAVAATKTYTAELLALLMLVESVRGGGTLPADELAALRELPGHAASVLADDTVVDLAARYRFADRLVTTGRGYAYPTARETALKLMETCYLAGLAFSGADLLHGPLAMADPDVPVLAVVGSGPAGQSMRDVVARLGERRADTVVFGPAAVEGASGWVRTPDVDERYAPLLDILPLQRLALSLALLRGEDPDAPRGLKKVTSTL
ncbi:SIS domain-containing protein [Dactylosporangium matsuzakiense]|uniref:Glutamine-fructose-6-phosphate transaminase n=2 Tax=Dactylosporangium matsuzakiense TaxID=53360 RepID=A0A9W6KDJ9_9ACTN|nr:glutamine-fructose-6-phosphate transaminase [Dactylosporangium matsuzakiense]